MQFSLFFQVNHLKAKGTILDLFIRHELVIMFNLLSKETKRFLTKMIHKGSGRETCPVLLFYEARTADQSVQKAEKLLTVIDPLESLNLWIPHKFSIGQSKTNEGKSL